MLVQYQKGEGALLGEGRNSTPVGAASPSV